MAFMYTTSFLTRISLSSITFVNRMFSNVDMILERDYDLTLNDVMGREIITNEFAMFNGRLNSLYTFVSDNNEINKKCYKCGKKFRSLFYQELCDECSKELDKTYKTNKVLFKHDPEEVVIKNAIEELMNH